MSLELFQKETATFHPDSGLWGIIFIPKHASIYPARQIKQTASDRYSVFKETLMQWALRQLWTCSYYQGNLLAEGHFAYFPQENLNVALHLTPSLLNGLAALQRHTSHHPTHTKSSFLPSVPSILMLPKPTHAIWAVDVIHSQIKDRLLLSRWIYTDV